MKHTGIEGIKKVKAQTVFFFFGKNQEEPEAPTIVFDFKVNW